MATSTVKAIALPPGGKTKRNGACTVPPALASEYCSVTLLDARGRPKNDQPLFVSQQGKLLNIPKLSKLFARASTLAFVKLAWPANDRRAQDATPLDVAITILAGKLVGFDGPRPIVPEKIVARERRRTAIEGLVELLLLLKPSVEKRLAGRPMYALRHTHITWARQFVNFDAVRAQVGHAARDIEELHYNDEERCGRGHILGRPCGTC